MKIKLLIVTWMVAFCNLVYSEEASKHHLQKRTIESTKYFDVNRITCSIRNNGIFARHPARKVISPN